MINIYFEVGVTAKLALQLFNNNEAMI